MYSYTMNGILQMLELVLLVGNGVVVSMALFGHDEPKGGSGANPVE